MTPEQRSRLGKLPRWVQSEFELAEYSDMILLSKKLTMIDCNAPIVRTT